jgi:cytochrome c-type biogenesis protein CcmE
MKKTNIVLLVLIAVVSAILISVYVGTVPSTTFEGAKSADGKNVRITGTLDKTQPIEYDPLVNSNLTKFHVVDSTGHSEKVYLTYDKGKPDGLEFSEKITLLGKFEEDGAFHANDIQMKCPSKYNDQKHSLETAEKQQ